MAMYLFVLGEKGLPPIFSFGVNGHPSTVLFGRGWPPIYFSLWRGWSFIYFLFGFLFGRGLPNCLFFLFGTTGHLSSFYLGGDGFCFPIWRGWPPI